VVDEESVRGFKALALKEFHPRPDKPKVKLDISMRAKLLEVNSALIIDSCLG